MRANSLAKKISLTSKLERMEKHDMMLSLFDCLPIFVDRSGTDVKVTIVNPFGNIAGTIQPDVFVKLYKGHLTENGFLHRIMAVYNDGPDELPCDSGLESRIVQLFIMVLLAVGTTFLVMNTS